MRKTTARRMVSLILAVCMLFLCTATALAAGEGYADIIRVYRLSGINGKAHVSGEAYMYGKTTNNPADNYVALLKVDTNTGVALVDVLNGEAFNALLLTCISSSQLEVSNFNELLLSFGAPDEFLMLDNKPFVVSEIEKAVAQKQASVTIRDNLLVFPDALKMAAAKGCTSIKFDTIIGNAVNVRITVNPAYATKGFSTYANAITNPEDPNMKMMAKFYTNTFATIDFSQDGSFGTTVQVAAKADLSGLNTSNLVFYQYDYFNNAISRLEKPNYSIDAAGYLHFETSVGGTIFITDQLLAKR